MAVKRRKRVCFAQRIDNYGRYQEWAKCLLDRNRIYAVRYNDFDPWFAESGSGIATKVLCKLDRIMKKARAIPAIAFSDVVVFSNMGIDYRLFSIAHALRKETIVDVYVSQYQTQVLSRKTIPEGSRRARKLLERERSVFSRATKLVFLNENEKGFYSEVVGCQPERAYILPLYNAPKRKARLGYFSGEKAKPRFCWWGGGGNPVHGLENIVQGLKRLEESGCDFDFDIFSWDESEHSEHFASILRSVGWEQKVRVRYEYGMEDGRLERYLAEHCDVAFGPLSLEPKAVNVVSNKALDAINMQIPLVTVDSPAMRLYFSDDMICYCDDLSPDAVCRRLQMVLSDSGIDQRAVAAKAAFEESFGTAQLNQKFIDIVED